jgi:cytidylate kinase
MKLSKARTKGSTLEPVPTQPPKPKETRSPGLERDPAAGLAPPSAHGKVPGTGTVEPGATATLSPGGLKAKLDQPRFEQAFIQIAGPDAMKKLRDLIGTSPVVLVGGDQCTGKDTVGDVLAQNMGGEAASVGKMSVRRMATERGITVEAMSVLMKDLPDVDRHIDYEACKVIAEGKTSVLNSRLAGQLCRFMRGLGRAQLFSVYLTCAPREQALRWVSREISPEARRELDLLLPEKAGKDMAAVMKTLAGLRHPAAAKVAETFQAIAGRDAQDHSRLQNLYGVDYRDRSVYDVVVDTTHLTPDQVRAAVVAALPRGFARQ